MFYTRLPVPSSHQFSEEALSHSRKYFPFIGIIVGVFAAFSLYVCQLFLPLSLAVLCSIVVSIFMTGAFHEDGFADSCDGFGGGWKKDQILTIMKDSRVGTYAVVGLLLLFGIKAVSLYELSKHSLTIALLSYVCAHSISRFGASLCIDCLAYVQDIDKSKVKPITSMRLPFTSLIYSGSFTLPIFGLLLYQNIAFIWSLFPLLAAFILGNRYFKKRIGGYTGDCLGAMQQSLEVLFYISILSLSNLNL